MTLAWCRTSPQAPRRTSRGTPGTILPDSLDPTSWTNSTFTTEKILLKTQEHKNPGYSRKSRPRFHGSCLMQLQALATQQMLTFHSDELAINLVNVSLTEMGSQPEPFLPQQIILDFQRTFVTLVLPGERPFQEGKTYNLLVEFSSTKRRGNQTW